jgi:hypothetical protein
MSRVLAKNRLYATHTAGHAGAHALKTQGRLAAASVSFVEG